MEAGSSKLLSFPTFFKYDFKDCYLKQCENRNINPPTRSLASQTDSSKLKINADRIRLCDWEAIFSVLKIENTLKEIEIYSKKVKRDWPQCVWDQVKTSLVASSCPGPAIFTRYILEKLIRTLAKSLMRPESVCEALHVELPLSPEYCLILSNGIQGAARLTNISLAGSCIGNDGCHYLCDALKTMPNIRVLNLSGCKLGVQATESLTSLIHSHSLMRDTVSWENSFRYRSPGKKIDIGLVRITLNKNPEIGDDGAKKLADVLIDDKWIKAIDLQQCQISNKGGIKLLTMIGSNHTICILDIRGNQGTCSFIKESIQKALLFGSRNTDKTQMEWLPPPSTMKART